MITLVAYLRVSTRRQGDSGLGLEAQRAAVEAYADRIGATVIEWFTEVESGRKSDRPILAAAFALARLRGAKVVVAKLDRLARDVRFILKLADGGVPIVFLDLPDLDCSGPLGRLQLTMMAMFAEFEARRIAQRIREALAQRKARGAPGGTWDGRGDAQKRGTTAAWKVNQGLAAQRRLLVVPLTRGLQQTEGLTLAEVAMRLNSMGIRTRSGRPWTLANLARVLNEPIASQKGE